MSKSASSESVRQLLTSSAAAEQLGLKPEQFRRLAKRLGLKPEDSYRNPHYKSGPECPLWAPEHISKIHASEIEAVHERAQRIRTGKATMPQRRAAGFAAKYTDWRAAVPPACESLFNLNRYAKHGSCSRDHREEIYDLKTGLIELLYLEGYGCEVKTHLVARSALSCNRCQGSGEHWSGERCEKCDGTGVFREADTLAFVAFRFEVCGKRYGWHQPEDLVTWEYHLTVTSEQWEPEAGEKPIQMAAKQFAEAKALIRWTIQQCKKTKPGPKG